VGGLETQIHRGGNSTILHNCCCRFAGSRTLPQVDVRREIFHHCRELPRSSDCAPSLMAFSGAGCISTRSPSAPMATAAREEAPAPGSLSRAWLGSRITGKWVSSFSAATAAMSQVLRVTVSKVRMPRCSNSPANVAVPCCSSADEFDGPRNADVRPSTSWPSNSASDAAANPRASNLRDCHSATPATSRRRRA